MLPSAPRLAAGGTIVKENTTVGLATVRATNANFLSAVTSKGAVRSAMANRAVGQAPGSARKPDSVENDRTASRTAAAAAAAAQSGSMNPRNEPLADRQWDMRMIGPTPNGSSRINQGSHEVRVGIVDTGVDGNHPDIKGNFDRKLSRNFVTDIPVVDDPCGSSTAPTTSPTRPSSSRSRPPSARPRSGRWTSRGPMRSCRSPFGVEQTDVSAPGGDSREGFGTNRFNLPENRVLSPLPLNVAIAGGNLNPDGTPNTPLVLRDCKGGTCAYYQYLQGTSMASPHAVGVAALIVSTFGHHDGRNGGLTLDPRTTDRILRQTATQTPCPVPPLFDYPEPNSVDARCDGTIEHNGFYGDGVVNALSAVLR